MISNLSNFQPPQTSVTSFNKCSNKVTSILADTSVDIVAANSKRLYAAFINNSEVPITLILGERSDGTIDKGIPLSPGGSFEINLMNLYRGKVSAISDEKAKLSWVECEG